MSTEPPTRPRSWNGLDRIIRSVHLYTGLFLAPWMLIYALSALCLNHGKWINEVFQLKPPQWERIRETSLEPGRELPDTPTDRARAILQVLDLDGPHFIQGKPTEQELVIIRASGRGNLRVTWQRERQTLRVERQQPPSLVRLSHFLHFRHGYQQSYWYALAWAVVVDAVWLSMIFWVASGIYLWARRPNRRKLGTAILIAGVGLFGWLVILFCQ